MTPDAGFDEPVAARTGSTSKTLFRGKWWFWAPVVPLVALDLWSKAAAFDHVGGQPGRQVPVFEPGALPFGFSLVNYRNTGSIWGIGQELTILLMVFRCVALLVILWFMASTRATQRFQQLVLALIFAGAIGNLYDNFVMPDRGVRDFLLFYYEPSGGDRWHWPAFNVADSCISVGAVLLLILLWREPDPSASGARARDTGKA